MIEESEDLEDFPELSPAKIAREKKIRKEQEPFREHQETCKDCRFFPLSMACFVGAKLMNPDLPDTTEEEYLHRIARSHEDCGWCHGE